VSCLENKNSEASFLAQLELSQQKLREEAEAARQEEERRQREEAERILNLSL